MEDKDITKNIIRILIPERLKNINLPLFLESVSAGFPPPPDDFLEGKLDLNDFLIPNPPATFLVHVTGDSMIGAGIYSGDLLIVDRSVEPHNRNIVIAVLDGELTVKRLIMEKDEIKLVAENKNYKPIKITEQMQFEIWGVVRTVIHSLL
jgi:DNA polymerase V